MVKHQLFIYYAHSDGIYSYQDSQSCTVKVTNDLPICGWWRELVVGVGRAPRAAPLASRLRATRLIVFNAFTYALEHDVAKPS